MLKRISTKQMQIPHTIKGVYQMKKIMLLCLLSVLVLTACNNNLPTTPGGSNRSYLSLVNKLGDVNNVYHQNAVSRFFDGENIINYRPENPENKDLVFIAELVEYNSFNKAITNYIIEKHPNKDAYSHQSYKDVTYKEDKVYVEFSAYVDKKTGEVLVIEVRIVKGIDYLNFNGDWYANSCSFSKDMSTDLDLDSKTPFQFAPQFVDLNKIPSSTVTYNCANGTITDSSSTSSPAIKVDQQEIESFLERLSAAIGTKDKEYGINNYKDFTSGKYLFASLNNSLIVKMEKTTLNAQNRSNTDLIRGDILSGQYPNDYFIEINVYLNKNSVNFRIIDQDKFKYYIEHRPNKNEEGYWYAKSFRLTFDEIENLFGVKL